MTPGLYDAATTLAGPLLRLRLAWRARREPGYGERVDERFGRYDPPTARALAHWCGEPGPRLWLHAVSLGETRAAQVLATALRERRPDLRILWTHGTATGRAAGAERLPSGDLQLWQPWDAPGAVARFLDAARPDAGVLMETEVWPNLLRAARERGVPMVLANARLSDRSLQRGQRLRRLLRPAVRGLSLVLAQTADDAGRLVAAGADPSRVQVCGNLKFDSTPSQPLLALGRAWKRTLGARPVVLMAVSREGEEGPLLAAWSARLAASPAAGTVTAPPPLLLIVPRHPQRFDAVAAMASAAGLHPVRRSAFGEAMPGRAATEAAVWLGDSLGEMAAYYALADVALLGGSFAPLGGQNLIEAAACGCPLVLGPHTFNFDEAARLAVQAGAAVRVATIGEAVGTAWSWVTGAADAPSSRPGADGRRALAFAAQHRGAAARMAAAILPVLAPALPDPAPG